ncbi:MAG: sulfurtransferase TusA family protein [Nitrospirae bacterium]|nr:sulfurtransferase TusA family protein [Nitrospirota bacterium]MCL5284715.1 sulfurtransferase TusA family protein [Nitrospirota bacterium]
MDQEKRSGTPNPPDAMIDLRGVKCPFNFVKTKLKLEAMESGETLSVILDPGEPIANVPRSVQEEGHALLGVTERPDGLFEILVKKA